MISKKSWKSLTQINSDRMESEKKLNDWFIYENKHLW